MKKLLIIILAIIVFIGLVLAANETIKEIKSDKYDKNKDTKIKVDYVTKNGTMIKVDGHRYDPGNGTISAGELFEGMRNNK